MGRRHDATPAPCRGLPLGRNVTAAGMNSDAKTGPVSRESHPRAPAGGTAPGVTADVKTRQLVVRPIRSQFVDLAQLRLVINTIIQDQPMRTTRAALKPLRKALAFIGAYSL